jgi:hypothetical protein
MAAVAVYFAYQNDLDYEQAFMFVLLPGVAVFGCLMLGVDT